MLGRALFTVVGLIIAAGLVVPFYPQTTQTPSATPAPEAVALLAAPVEGADPGSCRPDCGCGERFAATLVLDADPPGRLTLTVTVRVLPADTWPPKLPAI
jgi:hypothetical protein